MVSSSIFFHAPIFFFFFFNTLQTHARILKIIIPTGITVCTTVYIVRMKEIIFDKRQD